jgi:hypothetical protein
MKLFILYLALFSPFTVSGQDIVGKWYSQDSTRIYTIYKTADGFEALLESSTRKVDKKGVYVLRHVTENKKKRYDGIIYSVVDGTATVAKIRFEDKEGRILRLRLKRLFFMNATLRWYRA